MDSKEIVRVPIKIRQSIHKDFCSCDPVQVMSVGGVPYLIYADKLHYPEFGAFMDKLTVSPPILVTGKGIGVRKALRSLHDNLPVILRLESPLEGSDVIMEMSRVPGSHIQFSVEFPDDSLRKRLSPLASNPFSFRENMHLAKSRKISQSLEIIWWPHLTSILDVMELIEMTKNYVSHIVIKFPVISDEDYVVKLAQWSSIGNSVTSMFKSLYEADVKCRSWRIKPRHRNDMMRALLGFTDSKKLTTEIVSWDDDPRIRHESYTTQNPMGFPSALYQRGEDGKFGPVTELHEEPCAKCGKTLLF